MTRLINAFEQILDGSGDPLANGLIDFFESGSSSARKTTFADSAQKIANSNPVVLGGDGRCPNVFGTGSYNAILKNSAGEQIVARDPLGQAGGLSFGNDWSSTIEYSATDQVRDAANYWQSLVSGNLGNQPSLDSGAKWVKTDFTKIIVNTNSITALDATKISKTGGAFTGQVTSTAGDFNIVTNTALSNAAATLTAAQLIGGEFTITPTVARIQTLDTAANIISALSGSVDGSNFTFTIINLAAFNVTIATAAGVTLVGNMAVNKGSATFRVRRLSSTTVSVMRLDAALKEYESAPQTITNAGLLTLNHGLGEEPKFFDFHLVCTSVDAGYSVGDKIQVNFNSTSPDTRFNTYYFNSTQIFFRFANNPTPLITGNKSSGAVSGVTANKWNLIVRAYA
jgi:hypothetical protein